MVNQLLNGGTHLKKQCIQGFYFTGQVDIESRIKVTAGGPVKGVTSGKEEVPFLQIANTLFSTIFGRRLGTTSDGTTLRARPQEKVL